MTVDLELRPEIEAQLVAQARASGLSVGDYLKRLVELQAGVNSVQTMSYEEWERGFEAMIDSFPQQPVLSDQSVSRDSIYTREDEL